MTPILATENNKKYVLFHSVSVIQEKLGWAVLDWVFSWELQGAVRMLTGAVIEGLTGSEGSIPNLPPSHGWQGGTDDQQVFSVPPCGPFFSADGMSAGSPRISDQKEAWWKGLSPMSGFQSWWPRNLVSHWTGMWVLTRLHLCPCYLSQCGLSLISLVAGNLLC